jgi:hypothetical protein
VAHGVGSLLTAVALHAHRARADLHDGAERVAEAWRGVGAAVVVDRPRFLTDDNDDRRPVVVIIPELPEGDCTTVVLLGARGLGFHVRVADGRTDDAESERMPSVAGALSIERCGDTPPHRLVIASDSGRGAVETVVARSSKPLPPLRQVLPERSGGALIPASDPGPLPPPPSPERRADAAEARAKRDGAVIVARTTLHAASDGTGGGEETLDPGCHALELFASDPRAGRPTRRAKLDLDAEMRDASDDRVLARDRTDAPDAQLSTCVGKLTRVDVVFVGSPSGAPVLVTHAARSLPEHLPAVWGDDVRGRIAHVLLARHVVSLPHAPVMLAQGGSGTTTVPLSIEPGACYVVVAGLVKEAARSIGLRVRVGGREAVDDRGVDGDGAAAAFCAAEQAWASVEIEARGTPLLGWGLALYRMQSGIWEISP